MSERRGSQSAAAFNGLVTGLYQGLTEFIVPLQINGPGHDGRLNHTKTFALYEHKIIWPVEESDCFAAVKATSDQFTRATVASFDSE
jgi:hypothetical protein